MDNDQLLEQLNYEYTRFLNTIRETFDRRYHDIFIEPKKNVVNTLTYDLDNVESDRLDKLNSINEALDKLEDKQHLDSDSQRQRYQLQYYKTVMSQILPVITAGLEFVHQALMLKYKRRYGDDCDTSIVADQTSVEQAWEHWVQVIYDTRHFYELAWRYLLNKSEFQSMLIYLFNCEQFHNKHVMSEAFQYELVQELTKKLSAKHALAQAAVYFYYKRTGEMLLQANVFVQLEQVFLNLSKNPSQQEIELAEASLKEVKVTINELPKYLKLYLNARLMLQCAQHALKRGAHNPAGPNGLLFSLVCHLGITTYAIYAQEPAHQLENMLGQLKFYIAIENALNIFSDPDYLADSQFRRNVITSLAVFGKRYQKILDNNNSIVGCLECLDTALNDRHLAFLANQKHTDVSTQEHERQLMLFTKQQIEPLLKTHDQSCSAILKLANDLDNAIESKDKVRRFLSEFSTANYQLPKAWRDGRFGKRIIHLLPKTFNYWSQSLRNKLEYLTHLIPSEAPDVSQYTESLNNLFSHVGCLVSSLGCSVNINDLYEPYQPKVDFANNSVGSQPSANKSKNKRHKRKNKKNISSNNGAKSGNQLSDSAEQISAVSSNSGSVSLDCQTSTTATSLVDSSAATLFGRFGVIEVQGRQGDFELFDDEYQEDDPGETAASSCHVTPSLLSTSDETAGRESAAGSDVFSCSSPVELGSGRANLRFSIPDEAIPPLLKFVASELYKRSAGSINLGLTGGAVLALCKNQPHKVRDYDCVAIVNKETRFETRMAQLQECLSQISDPDDMYGWNSVCLNSIDSKHHPLMVIESSLYPKIEIGVAPPVAANNNQNNSTKDQSNATRYEGQSNDTRYECAQQDVEAAFYNDANRRDFGPLALLITQLHDKCLNGYWPVKAARGVVESLRNNEIVMMATNNELAGVKQRLLEDPARLNRLIKLRLTYPELQPVNRLYQVINNFYEDITQCEQLIEQAAEFKKQLGTTIERGLFANFSVEVVVDALLDQQMPILAAITGLPKDGLQACRDIWIDHINQAQDPYTKKLYLFECLLTASYILQPHKPAEACEQPLFYDIKTRDVAAMNYISHTRRDERRDTDYLFVPDVYKLINKMQEHLEPLVGKFEQTQPDTVDQPSFGPSRAGCFAMTSRSLSPTPEEPFSDRSSPTRSLIN